MAASRGVSADPAGKKGFRVPRPVPVKASVSSTVLDDDAPSSNYALRLTEALEAISAAQNESPLPLGEAARSAGEGWVVGANAGARADTHPSPPPSPRGRGSFLASLDKLPPIRLPIGPPIPWRLGLPALLAMVVLMGVMSRSSAHADSPGVQLPAQQTYPVQQEAPLFNPVERSGTWVTNNALQAQASNDDQQAPMNAPQTQTQTQAPAAAQPLGVQDPGGVGFDVFDIGIKLAAVLGLAYGSLMLLKRAGIGGASAGRSGGTNQGMRVVSSLALAPNRTVHVIKVAGGRTLLIGATPNAVNLLADLGDLADEDTPEAASFFDVLKGKLN